MLCPEQLCKDGADGHSISLASPCCLALFAQSSSTMKKMFDIISRKSEGTAKGDGDEDFVTLGKSTRSSGEERGVGPLVPAVRRRFSLRSISSPTRSFSSPTNPDTQSTVDTTPMPWSHSDVSKYLKTQSAEHVNCCKITRM